MEELILVKEGLSGSCALSSWIPACGLPSACRSAAWLCPRASPFLLQTRRWPQHQAWLQASLLDWKS